jgi:signal transduction histidine kinase
LPPRSPASSRGSGHFGIVGMNERARTIGGVLRIDSAPGAGTRITVQVPLDDPVPGRRRSIGAR